MAVTHLTVNTARHGVAGRGRTRTAEQTSPSPIHTFAAPSVPRTGHSCLGLKGARSQRDTPGAPVSAHANIQDPRGLCVSVSRMTRAGQPLCTQLCFTCREGGSPLTTRRTKSPLGAARHKCAAPSRAPTGLTTSASLHVSTFTHSFIHLFTHSFIEHMLSVFPQVNSARDPALKFSSTLGRWA